MIQALAARVAVVLAACSFAGCQKVPASAPTETAPSEPAQAQAEPEVTIEAKPVAGKVYALFGRGGNIGVQIGDDGTLVIDDQFAPLAPKIRAAIAGLGGGEIEFLINTHWHGDHTGGNPVFGKDAHIIAHANVRQRLSTTQNVRGRVVEPLPDEGLPVLTFTESVSLHFNGEEIKVIHLPTGHTDGDSAIWFTGSNALHMGDQFFNGKFPFVDLESGGDVEAYAANIARVIDMVPDDIAIIPGHGPLATKADLQRFHTMLRETTAHVAGQMKKGASLIRIQRAGFPKKFAAYDGGFIDAKAWIATLHASLSAR